MIKPRLSSHSSHPPQIAATIEAAVERLRATRSESNWRTWKDLPISGRIIFCEICKAARFATSIVADVTTLNFNLLFEIGFSIGLGRPVLLVRDTSYMASKRDFDELGVLDTIGYLDFANSEQLSDRLNLALPGQPIPRPPVRLFSETPLYVLKGPVNTDGAVKLLSTLKKSALRFRTYDAVETPRLSLFEARRQVSGSVGIVAHLLSPERRGALVHNALCALLAGVAMAEQKVVVMLQEEAIDQPLDYRDVVQSYAIPDHIPALLERSIRLVVQQLQKPVESSVVLPEGVLEKLDLGDPAAENEIGGLREYFVQTGQFQGARHGHSRLVVGRKGTGKTALFYAVRASVGRGHSNLVLDLRPEGHQFLKLRETVLGALSPGVQEHTMTAFWTFILLAEIAHKIIWDERAFSQRDPERFERWRAIERIYGVLGLDVEDDLSQRLLKQVDRIEVEFAAKGAVGPRDRVTDIIFKGDIRSLEAALSAYLQEKEAVWLLIDNLDKGWPTRGTKATDIVILRALLEAARKLQQQFEVRSVELRCLVFLRTDVYEHLVQETPDKGKDSAIRLDWDDPQVFEEIVRKRVAASTALTGQFREIWPRLFDSHIGAEDSFRFMLERTLMRPRDILQFLQRAIEVAVNRSHNRVTESDIRQAEQSYSEDLLLTTAFEIADTQPSLDGVVFAFRGVPKVMSRGDLERVLNSAGVPEDSWAQVIELLAWFGFLGVTDSDADAAQYSYEVRYNVDRLLHRFRSGTARAAIHPGYRAALEIR
ncbi:MAG: hypothetical protein LAO05_14210 [Acidobacteriia bacterium]|nr:hypothetical protein [Terriglobia bacterium]